MTDKQLSALIPIIAQRLLTLIVERNDFSEIDAIRVFYTSKLYETLSREETKVWHFSAETLYTLLNEELTTGNISYPEEL